MTERFSPAAHLLILLTLLVSAIPVSAQPAATPAVADSTQALLAQAKAALDEAVRANVDLLAPRRYHRALEAFDKARSVAENSRDAALAHVKLRVCLEELESARQVANLARDKLGEAFAARAAALTAGADTLSSSNWSKAEDRFRSAIQQIEESPQTLDASQNEQIAGVYRVARRDALRTQILGEARARIAEVEGRGGTRTVPTLLLRAQQAVSRAEAELAQEELDSARADARVAVQTAQHALALMDYAAAAQKERDSWEAALLPYDDLLDDVAARLDGKLDFSQGGARTGPQINALISARQDSLAGLAISREQMLKSLEASLAEAQTNLTDAQNRITELENRLRSLQGEQATTREALEKSAITADRISRAQEVFKPGEAAVALNQGNAVIRLQGLRFASGATKPDKTQSKLLDRAAEAIALFPGAAITVEGHTDSEGGQEVNQELSQSRAESVAAALTARLKLPAGQIKAVGYGESQPIAGNDTAEGRARNRRIDIVLDIPK
jgi:OOP family OmpA-OmpF porin